MKFLLGTMEDDAFRAGGLQIGIKGCSWAQEASERTPFSAEIKVEIFELIGLDTLVWTSICCQSFRFRLDGQTSISDGDRMTVGLDIVRGSILDRSTKDRPRPERPMPTSSNP